MSEREYIISLGQPDPGPELDYPHEGAEDQYVSPPEQATLFPRGLPNAGHAGGLASLSRLSRGADQVTGAGSPVDDSATQHMQNATGPAQAAVPEMGPSHRTMMTGAPDAYAKADRAGRQTAATTSLAHSVGTIVRLIASAAAGGAAGGAGGAGAGAGEAGAAAGTEAGAGSGAGFGSNFSEGFSGGTGSGSGFGGFLGRLAGNVKGGSGGPGGGQLASLGGGGGMMGGRNKAVLGAIDAISGDSARRRAVLQEAGLGGFSSGLVEEGDEPDWYGGS